MTNELPSSEFKSLGKHATLCNTLKEILEVLWHHNKENKEIASLKPKLSIHVRKKSQVTKDDLDIFTVKVKYNQHVPLMSHLQDISASKLLCFVEQMQAQEHESHLAIRTAVDEDLTKTSVLWILQREDCGHFIQIQDEIWSKTLPLDSDALALQLRVFMKASSMVKEFHSISSLLCCTKMLNPWMDFSLCLDGILDVNVDFRLNDILMIHFTFKAQLNKCSWKFLTKSFNQIEFISCGCLQLSIDPKVYDHSNLSNDDRCVADMSLLVRIPVSCQDVAGISSQEHFVTSALIFLPKYTIDISKNVEREFSLEKHGKICIISCPIVTDSTLSPAPYNTGCCVKIIQDASLPQVVKDCDAFTLWICFVLQHKLSDLDTVSHGTTLDSLRKLAKESFKRFFLPNIQEETQVVPDDTQKENRDMQNKWILDISSSLSEIYTKSTDATFRGEVAQMVSVDTCLSMKSHLQDMIENILGTNARVNKVQPSPQSTPNFAKEEQEWRESQVSLNGQCREGSMSPDSLELLDTEWDEMMGNEETVDRTNHQQESICGDSMPIQQPKGFHSWQEYDGQTLHDTIDKHVFNNCNLNLETNLLETEISMCNQQEDLCDIEGEINRWRDRGDINDHLVDYPCEEMDYLADRQLFHGINSRLGKCKNDAGQPFCGFEHSNEGCIDEWGEGKMERIDLVQETNSDSQLEEMRIESLDTATHSRQRDWGVSRFEEELHDLSFNELNNCSWKALGESWVDSCNVPNTIANEEPLDDWYDKDQFDQWCAQIHDG